MAKPRSAPRILPSASPSGLYAVQWYDAHGRKRRESTKYTDYAEAARHLPIIVAGLLSKGETIEGLSPSPLEAVPVEVVRLSSKAPVAVPAPAPASAPASAPARAPSRPYVSAGQLGLTVAQAVELYLDEHVALSDAPRARIDTFNTLQGLVWWYGERDVGTLRLSDFNKYRVERRAGMVPPKAGITPPRMRACVDATIRNHFLLFGAALTYCKKAGHLPEAWPLPAMPEISKPKARTRWFTQEEAAHLLTRARGLQFDGMSDEYKILVLGLATASRITAIVDLKWSRVHFPRNTVDFVRDDRIQTKKRRAEVYMSVQLREMLEQAYALRKGDYVIENRGAYRQFLRFLQNSGLDLRKGEGAHVMRHTWASWQVQAGTPLAQIADVMSTTVKQVEETYAKLNDAVRVATVDRVALPLPEVAGLSSHYAPPPTRALAGR